MSVRSFDVSWRAMAKVLIAENLREFHQHVRASIPALDRLVPSVDEAGVMAALPALPIAAIYPTIERIWLCQQLSEDTVEKHERLSA